MPSFLSKLFGWLFGYPSQPQPRIHCSAQVWQAGVEELARRTLRGRRESGAFLLGRDVTGGGKQILEFVFYDDIDPHALDTGIVHFAGNRLPILWEHCRQRGYGVVADVHVHPGGYGQSPSDQADPVMSRAGHIALILPHFAQRGVLPGEIGLYEYLGNDAWVDHSKSGNNFFRVG